MDETAPREHLNPLERFGRDVKQVRLARRLTQKHLGKSVGYSEAYVSRVEAGKMLPRPSTRFAEGCDLAFGTGELFTDLLRRIDEGDHPSWFVPYLNLERTASRILDYSGNLVMGLLQTREYARAIFRAGFPHATDDVIESKVDVRLRRREIFDREPPALLWIILHESCLRTVVGDLSVMAAQLEHLREAAETPQVDLQVLPFSAGAPAANDMLPFTLLTFNNASTVLYWDGPQGGKVSDSVTTIEPYLYIYDRLRAHALPPTDSLRLIEFLAKEYRNEL